MISTMKTLLLALACLSLAGCARQEQDHQQVMTRLAALEASVTNNRPESVRWAFANKREIESVIFQSIRDQMEKAKKAEALAPEIEAQVREYDRLKTELMYK